MAKAKKKAGVTRIKSTDLETQEKGWVEMCSYLKAKHLPYIEGLEVDLLSKDYPTPQEKAVAMEVVYEMLAVFVEGWNWKDGDGTPYSDPAGNPGAFGDLRPAEFGWVMNKVGEVIAEGSGVPKANATA